MAWAREYNAGQKGVGERWSVISGRPDATNTLTWSDTNSWTGTVWVKETTPASSWTKEV